MCSHEVPKGSHIPLQTFPIAPHSYALGFAQSSTLM
jgi:hypothetical protein